MIGCDNIGKFQTLTITDEGRPTKCGICKEPGVCIRYRSPSFNISEYVRNAPSLLIRKRNKWVRTIGITCGCYAKVHRQISIISRAEQTGRGVNRP